MARHHALIDEAIRDLILRRVENRILLVRTAPRHGKSEIVSHWTPAWFLLNWPDQEVIVTGYGERFSQKWGRRSRDTFNSLSGMFGTGLHPGRQAVDNWGTIDGGGCITAGMGGGIGGEGAGLLIVDDLIKNSEDAQSESYREKSWDWFRSTAWTRLSPDGVCIVIGTSWHRDDYQQRIIKEFGDEVVDICLPAIAETNDPLGRKPGEALWPAWWSLKWLRRQEKIAGSYYFNALYQQRPTQHEKAEWPESYFDDIWTDRLPDRFEHCVIAIDPARGTAGKKGSYCPDVLVGWSGNKYWVWSDVARRPVEDAALTAVSKALKYDVDIVHIESNGLQYLAADVVRDIAANSGLPHLLVDAKDTFGNKLDRIRRLGPRLQDRQIIFLDCPGNRLLVEQLKDFPIGDHADGPDALEMAIRRLNMVAREKLENDHEDQEDD